MNELSDKELALSIELNQTRLALFKTQLRAGQAEAQLANVAGEETHRALQGLMVEQEKRAEAKAAADKAPEAKPE